MVKGRLDYEAIRKLFGADDEPPRTIVRRERLVLALCLNASMHPRIYYTPAEVWLEAGWPEKEWSQTLALDTGALWVFVSASDRNEYKSLGLYHVVGSSSEPVDLAVRMALPGIAKLGRIVFLTGPHRSVAAGTDPRTCRKYLPV